MDEKPFILKSGKYELPGVLAIPKGRSSYPLVIFVHGSGPNDRDETIGPNKPFRDIAHGLAASGIASLRYDKRTFVYGSQAFEGPESVDINQEVIDDVSAAIDTAQQIPGVSAIFIIGHSLGAMLAPKIANLHPELKGIVMLAGNARPLQDLILEQTKYILATDGLQQGDSIALAALKDQISSLDRLKEGVSSENAVYPLSLPGVYWKSVLDYDQISELKMVKIPVLILQGERDYQVTMTDFGLWKTASQGRDNVVCQSFPKLNHLFLEGEGPSYPSEYNVESHVPVYVISAIAEWITDIK